MPRPCHATTMSFWKPRHSAACPFSASSGYHAEFHEGFYEKHTNPLNCRTSSSDISGYHAEFHEGFYEKHTNPLNCRTNSSDISGYRADSHGGHGTVEGWHGMCEVTWHGMGAAWYVWISLKGFVAGNQVSYNVFVVINVTLLHNCWLRVQSACVAWENTRYKQRTSNTKLLELISVGSWQMQPRVMDGYSDRIKLVSSEVRTQSCRNGLSTVTETTDSMRQPALSVDRAVSLFTVG
jgi:hypothetical protein